MLVKYAIIYLLLCFTIGTAIHVENDETYQRPLKNFGTRASELTKEEEKTIESEVFTPKDWCHLYKMEINAKNVEQHEPSNILNCRPAHFGLNESNVVGKLRELEPITACHNKTLALFYRCLQPTPDSERERHARKKKNTKSGFSILG